MLRHALLPLLLSTSAAAAPLSGTFQSPLGPLRLKEDKAGTVVGVVVGKNACGFKKDTAVLQAARLDAATVAGTFTACRVVSEGCVAGSVVGDTILLVDKSGAALNGAVHMELGNGCSGPVTKTLKLKKTKATATKPTKDTSKAQALALVEEAAVLIGLGSFEEANAKCTAAAKLDPGLEAAPRCVGVAYYGANRYEEALEAYNKALEIGPAVGDTYYNIACLYARKGELEIALNYLRLAHANGFLAPAAINADGDLKVLKGNPEFEALRAGTP